MGDNEELSVDGDGNNNATAAGIVNNDIYPFINKPTPKIHVAYTVGGLEKRVAEGHWRALNRINQTRSPSGEQLLNRPRFLFILSFVCFVSRFSQFQSHEQEV